MKRSLSLILLAAVCALALAFSLTLTGCAGQTENDPSGLSDDPAAGQPVDGLPTIPGEEASYTSGYVDMTMTLPQDWRWEAVQTRGFTEGIHFWKTSDRALDFYLLCYLQGYGICGTGVTSEELTLPSGQTLFQHTERIGDGLWLNLVFSDVAGSYVLQPVDESIDEKAWEAGRDEVLAILNTVQLGRGSMTEQQAIDAAAAHYAEAYDTAYGSYDVRNGTWTVRFSTGVPGNAAAAFTVSPDGLVTAAAE